MNGSAAGIVRSAFLSESAETVSAALAFGA